MQINVEFILHKSNKRWSRLQINWYSIVRDFYFFFSVKIFGAKNIKHYKGEEITILNPSKVNYDWPQKYTVVSFELCIYI